MNRRDFLKHGTAAGIGTVMSITIPPGDATRSSAQTPATPRVRRKVIVGVGGIAGLCCAYELMTRGHDVVVLDASGRHGGHVFTGREGLSDGLYVDYGAEGFTKPCYERFWEYTAAFGLTVVPYRHRINQRTRVGDEFLTDQQRWARQFDQAAALGGFNEHERQFLSSQPIWNLESLYLGPYWEKLQDDYRPLGAGLDHLDTVPLSWLYEQDGASPAARALLGGGQASALFRIWRSFILHKRGIPSYHPEHLYRLQGGNQTMTDAFARRLGSRVQLDCRILEVAHGQTGVTVTYEEFGDTRTMAADFFANCLPVPATRTILFSPDLPPEKRFVLDNLTYDSYPRIAFQTRTKFWEEDGQSINLAFNHRDLRTVWQVAHEVETHRSVLMATGPGGVTPARAVAAFKALYPGNKAAITIEQTLVKDWTLDRFAPSCERQAFPMGTLARFWPHVMTPVGRIHFAGSYADNNNWGMEAATNSANRVAREIDQA
jgi:monoamine oxidase